MPTLREKTIYFLRHVFGNWSKRQPDSDSSPTQPASSTNQQRVSVLDHRKQQAARQAIDRFVQRFQPSYRALVYYAALPLVLTPELVHYLRSQFLQDVPWMAEVDLLLSGLCQEVGYELYAMETSVRACALAEMKQEVGTAPMQAVAQLLLEYVNQLWRNRPALSLHELHAQQWAAMVYLDDKRETAVQDMARSLSAAITAAASPTRKPGFRAQRADLAYLSRLVDTLAPELERYPDLVEYAQDVARILHDPAGISPHRLDQRRRAAGVDLPELRPLVPSPSVHVQETKWQEPWTGMEFVWVPPGRFMMGQTETDKTYLINVVGEKTYSKKGWEGYVNELPRHEVHIAQGFWIGAYPVTQAQWLKVMGDNPSDFSEKKVGEAWRDHPVEEVSWEDAQKFLDQLNKQAEPRDGFVFRLPSEAEWEYACRAGAETMFCFGDDPDLLAEYAWYDANSDDRTHPVGQLKPNAWGLFDVHGNVWEWCADDWHDSYAGAPGDGIAWQRKGEVNRKLLRGGSWNPFPHYCRCAFRLRDDLSIRYHGFGFRVVCGGRWRTL